MTKLFEKFRNIFSNEKTPLLPEPALVLKEYRIEIYTGAGMLKMNAKGYNEKEAKDKAIQQYLRGLTIKTRPI